ncbi:hypothetical protein MKX07_004502 [Trichoderma sp. CBMAI-0711]|nr:hypothetical protein MKX07_004502 [Trichoderma sp. CBMAI-0711]
MSNSPWGGTRESGGEKAASSWRYCRSPPLAGIDFVQKAMDARRPSFGTREDSSDAGSISMWRQKLQTVSTDFSGES